jgi:hypothetical protein
MFRDVQPNAAGRFIAQSAEPLDCRADGAKRAFERGLKPSPAAVGVTLRLVRLSNRTPRRAGFQPRATEIAPSRLHEKGLEIGKI